MYNNLFGFFEVAIGIYALYSAITGKGQLLKNDNVKKGMEQRYKKWMRILGAFLGPVMLGLGALDIYNSTQEVPVLPWLMTALMIASGILVVLLVVAAVRMTDRSKATAQGNAPQKGAPRAAFEFDDEDAE